MKDDSEFCPNKVPLPFKLDLQAASRQINDILTQKERIPVGRIRTHEKSVIQTPKTMALTIGNDHEQPFERITCFLDRF
jgi:hypothetical protein